MDKEKKLRIIIAIKTVLSITFWERGGRCTLSPQVQLRSLYHYINMFKNNIQPLVVLKNVQIDDFKLLS